MRTTLNIDDRLYRAVKQRAALTGLTITQIVEEALRAALRAADEPRPAFKLRWVTVEGRLRPGIDLADRDSLYELMEGRS